MAERESCTPALLSLLPFPLTPRLPYGASNSRAGAPVLTPPFNSIQLFLSFVPKRFVRFDLHQRCQPRSQCGALAASASIPCPSFCWQRYLDLQPGGVFLSIQRLVAAVTSAGQIPALSSWVPNCINSVAEVAYTEISCPQRGLSAPCLRVVWTGGEICQITGLWNNSFLILAGTVKEKKEERRKEGNKIGCSSAVLLQKTKKLFLEKAGVEVLYLVPLYILYLCTCCMAVGSLTCVLMLFVNDKISF